MKNLCILPTNKPSRLVKIYNDVSYLTIHDIEHTPEYVMVGCRIIRDRVVTLYNKFYSPELFGELTGESCRF